MLKVATAVQGHDRKQSLSQKLTSVPVLDRISIRADAQHFITFDKRQMMCGGWKYKNQASNCMTPCGNI